MLDAGRSRHWLFVAGAVVSLGPVTSSSPAGAIGERLGLSEALLGVIAALAADAPEITSAVTALASHQSKIGAGVIIGSNVFNLAALLGWCRGRREHRAAPQGGAPRRRGRQLDRGCLPGHGARADFARAGLIAVLAVLLPYLAILGAGHARLQRFALARRWETWLARRRHRGGTGAGEVIHPPHGPRRDFAIAAAPGDRGGGQRDHGAGASLLGTRSPYPSHHRRRRPRRGDQPAERGRRRLPGRQGRGAANVSTTLTATR